MKIKDAEILALKPKGKPYKVCVGESIYILVKPDGKKYWRFRYHLAGKEGLYSLSVFPKVSIKDAFAAKHSAKALIREGVNPAAAKREAASLKSPLSPQPLFRLGLSMNGALTIETDANVLTITYPQTQALRAFLKVNHVKKKGSQL